MRVPATVVVVLSTAMLVACGDSVSPTAPGSPLSAESGASAGANGNAADTATLVPFKGQLEGLLVSSTPATPPLLSNLIEATGTATHLGRFTLNIPHVVNTTTRTATGTYEFTAANGDTLVAEFTGQATPTAPGVLTVVENATITGGTGRFVHATGSFTAERVFTIATRVVTGTFKGVVSSPGANRQ